MNRPAALVLTAGYGTRLRPLTYVRAKAAVPVNGHALALRVSTWLAGSGFREQVFNLHYRPQTVAAVLGDGSDRGVRIRYSWENPVLGSAGGPRHALPLLTDGGSSRFVMVNGDTLTDVDLDRLLSAHESSGALVTMALIPNPAPMKYGGVLLSGTGDVRWVTGFSRPGAVEDTYHFIGVQVAEAAAFAALEDGVPYESVGALYPRLMAENPRSIAAFVSDAGFRDIGTASDCLQTSLALAAEEGDRLISPSASLGSGARVERTAIWDDVAIGRDARLVECLVADGVTLPDGASYERCAIIRADGRPPAEGEHLDGALLIRPL